MSELSPFVIAITGHRDLDTQASQQVYQHLRSFISQLKSALPDTPLLALTGMADGADRLLANVAIELGVKVKAILPMPVAMYQDDFSHTSLDEFNKLISHSDVAIEVVEQLNTPNKAQKLTGKNRDLQYWALGQYLINNANLLIAVWDGENSGLTGGTSDVLLDYLHAKPRRAGDQLKTKGQKISYLKQDDSSHLLGRIAYWIPVLRQDNGHSPADNKPPIYLSGEQGVYTFQCFETAPISLREDCFNLNEYNAQINKISENKTISSPYNLLNRYDLDKSPVGKQPLTELDWEFLKADAVAMHNQKFSDLQFSLSSMMAAIMGLFFLIYAKVLASNLLLIGYLLLFVVGWQYFHFTEKKHHFTRHLSARALAETLRTQFYLTLINRNNNKRPAQIMNYCGVTQFSGFRWLRHIIYTTVPAGHPHNQNTEQQSYNIEFVHQHWLMDQLHYFKKKAKLLELRHHKLEKVKSALFIGSALMAVLLILFKYQLVEIQLIGTLEAKTFTVLLMGLLPFLLGVWEIYQHKMAVKELLWQYRNQSILFHEAQKHMENATTNEQKCTILTELAERALMENYIWIIHRYHREHEPPTAG